MGDGPSSSFLVPEPTVPPGRLLLDDKVAISDVLCHCFS